jgi:SAM-dependent methyltransferase
LKSPDGGYDPIFYSDLYSAEDRHFWFRGRNRVIAAAVGRAVASLPASYRVLEVGCGSGNTMRVLQHLCRSALVIGMDLFFDGLRYARARGVSCLVQGDVSRPPFNVPFDLVGMFDVLEHVPDDVGALRHLHCLLREGARLVLTVPAHASLWSYFDEAARHCRRYEMADLAEKLRLTNYDVEYLTEFMMFSYPLVWLQRRWLGPRTARAAGAAETVKGELRIHPLPNFVLGGLQLLETAFVQRQKRLPFGTSILVVARKRATRKFRAPATSADNTGTVGSSNSP